MLTIRNNNSILQLSESSSNTPSALLTQRIPMRAPPSNVGTTASAVTVATPTTTTLNHSSLTQANLARINNANAQECHQGKMALHQSLKKAPLTQLHHQTAESVADASYYSSVLNSFGSSSNSTNSTNAAYDTKTNPNASNNPAAWQQSYYR